MLILARGFILLNVIPILFEGWWEGECTWIMVGRGMYLDAGGKRNVLG
jgi:hypothetical protein